LLKNFEKSFFDKKKREGTNDYAAGNYYFLFLLSSSFNIVHEYIQPMIFYYKFEYHEMLYEGIKDDKNNLEKNLFFLVSVSDTIKV
jgi:hypothetical protein